MRAVEITGLAYSYEDGQTALENLNMAIDEGETVAILGPNGAGKSTLLRIMTGLLFPTSGTLKIFGDKVTKKNADRMRAKVGLLFQDPDDQIFMPNVREDVAFGPVNLGMGKEEVRERTGHAMKIAGIEGFEDRVPHHLSYGEKKRVAIAGVLAMGPDILLLDEPTANLDPKSRGDLLDFIGGLGCTTIIATHDMDAAVRIADRAYILDNSMVEEGTMRELMMRPDVLSQASLEVPDIVRLFLKARESGIPCDEIPLSVEEALAWLSKR